MADRIDAHHHLWDLSAVEYPWLMAKGEARFFGDPAPIQRDYLLPEFRADAEAAGVGASVHIQVGAADPLAEARWVQSVADDAPDWPMAQVAFCDLTAPGRSAALDALTALPTVRGVRQIVGRSAEEDAKTGTNTLLSNPAFAEGLEEIAARGLVFDLQLTPPLMAATAEVLKTAPDLTVALCHVGSPHDRTRGGLAAWAEGLRTLSALPNVVCKLSGLGMFDHGWTAEAVRPIVKEAVNQFGLERVMWGSNFPVCSLSSTYAEQVARYEALVPEAAFSACARRVYFG